MLDNKYNASELPICNSIIMGSQIELLSYLKAGINRLLYPQKYIHKGIVQLENNNIVLDEDTQDETVLSFCELIFSHFFFEYLFQHTIESTWWSKKSSIIDVIDRGVYHVRNKKYATFHEVHIFLIHLSKTERARILHHFQFSNKTIIELLELLEEDDKYEEYQDWLACHPENKYEEDDEKDGDDDEDDDEDEDDEDEDGDDYENHRDHYTEDSHRCFQELIKRENYPPLFFAVSVYNVISKNKTQLELVDYAFTCEDRFKLDTLSIKDAKEKIEGGVFIWGDIIKLSQKNHPFSNCKFTEWVDEWHENFDSFVKKIELSKWICYESDEFEESYDYPSRVDFRYFLATRGWEFSRFTMKKGGYPYIILKEIFKKDVADDLNRWAIKYSIIQDLIPDEVRASMNWWLSQTHYYTVFNQLVEYYSAAYFDKGQEQTPLQESESSAAKKSNDDEQQNIPVIVIDKDETHKKWFVRVHEKKINAQPDEWNKKLYACLDALYDSLVKKGLMCESSKKELFIYRFSGFNIPEPFNPQEKIRWEGENVLLGHLVRCLITYTGTRAKGLGTVATFFESKRGKNVNLATADYISKEKFNQTPNMYTNLSLAVEILKECGFDEVEATSTRIRDK